MKARVCPCRGSSFCIVKYKKKNLFSSNSPGTEDVVKESLRDGLPIIPFAYPTFFTSSQKLEADSRLRRKSQSLYSKQRALGSGIGEDGVFQMDHEDECGGESLQTLDSIVEMAKLQMEVTSIYRHCGFLWILTFRAILSTWLSSRSASHLT